MHPNRIATTRVGWAGNSNDEPPCCPWNSFSQDSSERKRSWNHLNDFHKWWHPRLIWKLNWNHTERFPKVMTSKWQHNTSTKEMPQERIALKVATEVHRGFKSENLQIKNRKLSNATSGHAQDHVQRKTHPPTQPTTLRIGPQGKPSETYTKCCGLDKWVNLHCTSEVSNASAKRKQHQTLRKHANDRQKTHSAFWNHGGEPEINLCGHLMSQRFVEEFICNQQSCKVKMLAANVVCKYISSNKFHWNIPLHKYNVNIKSPDFPKRNASKSHCNNQWNDIAGPI